MATNGDKPLTITSLSREMGERLDMRASDIKEILHCLAEVAEDEISAGRNFTIPGIAAVRLTYQPRKPKRMVRNPLTGEERMGGPWPAKISMRARPMPALKRLAPSPTSKAGKGIADAYKAKH